MKLQVIDHTLFKQRCLPSYEVPYNEKISVYANTIFEIESYCLTEDEHWQVTFISPKPKNMTTWYVLKSQVRIIERDEDILEQPIPRQVSFSPSQSDWIWPMTGTSMGSRAEFGYARGRLHAGVDIGGYTPDECYAASDGIVDYIDNNTGGAEGRALYIKRADGWQHVYFHLQSIKVKVGQKISKGQWIAVRGGSGFGYEGLEIDGGGYSIHLHFEIRKPDNQPVDPRSILPRDGSVPIVG